MTKTKNRDVREYVRYPLAFLAYQIDPAQAKTAFDTLVAVMTKTTNSDVLTATSTALNLLAERLDPAQAKTAFEIFVAVINKSTNSDVLEAVGTTLAALAKRLDPAQAQTAFDTLLAVITKTMNKYVFGAVRHVLKTLAKRLEPAQAKTAFDALVTVLSKIPDSYHLYAVGDAFVALAERTNPSQADNTFESVLAVHAKTRDPASFEFLRICLAELSPLLIAGQSESRVQVAVRANFEILQQLNQWLSGYVPPTSLQPLLDHIRSIAFLTELLRLPACLGDDRDAVLARLEALAYPEPIGTAFLQRGADRFGAVLGPAAKAGWDEGRRNENRPDDRRFRTVADAAKWLAEHHPEIDLEKPYARGK